METTNLEIWKDIPDYEGIYQASNLGRIKSLVRKKWNGKVWHEISGVILVPILSKKGYLTVMLYKDSMRKRIPVHRLVAQAFLINPLGLPEINHIDETRTNNHVDNLEFCTHQYNLNYGTYQLRKAERMSKPVTQKTKSGETIKTFKSMIDAERQTGIKDSSIGQCIRGKLKHAGGFLWERA